MTQHSIIIDTDPGIDDAMAIFYALGAPEIDVVGITTVFGNAPVETTTRNALSLLEIAGRQDIPVARGAARPLASAYRGSVDHVHGADGQGNVALPPPAIEEDPRRATEFIIDTVRKRPGEITLVTLGPLTNLALLLLERPEIARNVKGVVAMGGNLYVPGNASPAAEANTLNDPESADLVLQAPWPVTMCGLDVTHTITMTPADLDRIAGIDTPEGRHLARILPFYHAFYATHVGSNGIYVHDSTTISWLRHPDAFTVEKLPLTVETGDGVGRGKLRPFPVRTRDGGGDTDEGSTGVTDGGVEPVAEPTAGSRLPGDERRPVTYCTGADARRLVEAEIAVLEGDAKAGRT
ncbi:MAG: nucleoside hydrolase [Alkalispirochaeta sp.]